MACHPERSEELALSEAKGSMRFILNANGRCFASLSMTDVGLSAHCEGPGKEKKRDGYRKDS